MAENPLLPHRRLQELHALMLRCRELEQQYRFAPKLSREAILAATAIQAEPGDVLFAEPDDIAVDQILLKPSNTKASASKVKPEQAKTSARSHLLLSAGIARGLQAVGKGVCFAFASAGSQHTSWSEGLSYAQNARLPLIVVCADASGSQDTSSKPGSLSFVSQICKGLRLPLLTVDGEDAIAVYRVVQESLLRARHGDGPAVVWCFLNQRTRAGRTSSYPLAHMEKYLAERGLKPLKRKELP